MPAYNQDLNMILDHFPDAVDVQLVDFTQIIESNWDAQDHMPPILLDEEFDHEIGMREIELHLEELEPETGIYATMSSFTHRVYVFVDQLEQ